MMMRILFLALALFSLSACYEDNDVTIHEPGVYKGKVDKHDLTAEQRAKILHQRFNQVQTDR
jgi:hypothetical protein